MTQTKKKKKLEKAPMPIKHGEFCFNVVSNNSVRRVLKKTTKFRNIKLKAHNSLSIKYTPNRQLTYCIRLFTSSWHF